MKPGIVKRCDMCDEEFAITSRYGRNRKTCSSRCANEYKKAIAIRNYYRNRERILSRKRRFYSKHKKMMRDKANNWRKRNPSAARRIERRYRERNKDKIKVEQKRWREENKDRCKMYSRRYRELNKAAIDAKVKEWRKKNREKCLEYGRKRYVEREAVFRAVKELGLL